MVTSNTTNDDPRSLRTFLDLLERTEGEGVARVEREVSAVHEAPAVVKKMEGKDDRAVLFENVAGSDMPVVMNLYGSKRRIAMAIGLDATTGEGELMSHFVERIAQGVPPTIEASGPVKDVVQTASEVDLDSLPIGVHAPKQGGKYIGSGVLLVRDPATGSINAGIYRTMVQGQQSVTVSVDPGHDFGKVITWGREHQQPVDFAIVIGGDPALWVASQAKVPMSRDVYEVMGSLIGAPVPVCECETNDLLVPSTAEIVLEGRIEPGLTAAEGPYGEFSYYYGSDPSATLCSITAITRRHDSIFADIHPTHGDHRCLWLHPGREAYLLQRLQALVPSVRAVSIPLEGASMVAFIAIDKTHAGDPKRALMFALCSDVFIKHAVIVDADVDIYDHASVLWALSTRFQPDRDLVQVAGVRGYNEDPSGHEDGTTAKIGYDATEPVGDQAEPADRIPAGFEELDFSDYVTNPLAAETDET